MWPSHPLVANPLVPVNVGRVLCAPRAWIQCPRLSREQPPSFSSSFFSGYFVQGTFSGALDWGVPMWCTGVQVFSPWEPLVNKQRVTEEASWVVFFFFCLGHGAACKRHMAPGKQLLHSFIGTFLSWKQLGNVAHQKEFKVRKPKPHLRELDRACSQLICKKVFSEPGPSHIPSLYSCQRVSSNAFGNLIQSDFPQIGSNCCHSRRWC